MSRPTPLPVLHANIPESVKFFPQWVLWRYKQRGARWTKPPYQINGKLVDKTNPDHWNDFSDVIATYGEGGYDGIGFCVTEGDPFTFLDLDHCINGKGISEDAQAVLSSMDSYTEISPSGEGLRIITKGQIARNIKKPSIEIYNKAWYLTITGQVYGQPQEVAGRQQELDLLTTQYLLPVDSAVGMQEHDQVLLKRICNSKQGQLFIRLFNGDLTGYGSHSEADLALCSILAFWTKNDQQVMERIFRGSKLYREKWVTQHGNRTYGQMTIEKALADVPIQLPSGEDLKKKKQQITPPTIITAGKLLKQEFPPRKNLLSPWLPEQGLCLLHAYRGVGKTHISLGIACAVATGSSFLDWQATTQQGVLFIDGEMPAITLQERIKNTLLPMDNNHNDNLLIITPDLQPNGMPDLGSREGQDQIDAVLSEDIKLIIVDNISTVCRSTMENKSDSWLPVQEWALRMRARGKSVLLVHHDGKGGQQRGSSRKEDVLDTVIQLTRPNAYTPDQGAVFEVHFRKNRGIHGDDAKPFEARLTSGEGGFTWQVKTLEESNLDKVGKLLEQGYSQKDIAEDLGLSRGYIYKLIQKVKSLAS